MTNVAASEQGRRSGFKSGGGGRGTNLNAHICMHYIYIYIYVYITCHIIYYNMSYI